VVIYNSKPYDYLRVRVQNKSTLAWTEILADGNEMQIQRGGSVGVLGIGSVNAGILELVLYNALDPAIVSTLSPKMKIQVYSTEFATPDLGSIYVGNITDISSKYFKNKKTNDLDVYVTLTAVDAVQSHANVTVAGVTTTAGFHRWEERISTLAPYALTTVTVPDINTNTVVDNF
jgi:hypothetical protein